MIKTRKAFIRPLPLPKAIVESQLYQSPGARAISMNLVAQFLVLLPSFFWSSAHALSW